MSAGERALHFLAGRSSDSFIASTPSASSICPKAASSFCPITSPGSTPSFSSSHAPAPFVTSSIRNFIRSQCCAHLCALSAAFQLTSAIHVRRFRAATEQIAAGEIVCLFPEGQLTRSGTLLRLRRGYELIAQHRERACRAGLARSTLGLRLLVSGRKVLHQMAEGNPVSRHRRIRQTTGGKGGRHCHCARGTS